MKEKRRQNDWKSGEGKLELENKPDGEEKGTSGQKPTMTYAEFKAQKGRKRGRDRGNSARLQLFNYVKSVGKADKKSQARLVITT